jgi:NAD(P)-dependent dehydrogenase (short-subunit alcohol dehydrogenase family)
LAGQFVPQTEGEVAEMPDDGLTDQHALVTGGSRGIGLAIVQALKARGLRVSAIARQWPTGAAPAGVLALAADVTDEDALAAALAQATDRHGPVTILVNNAGGVETAPFAHTDAGMVRRMLTLNLESVFSLTRLVLPSMLATRQGRIITVASTAGLKGYAYVTAYSAAKHGVIGMTRALAQEVASTGVTVNAVCPGYTETDLVNTSVAAIMAKTGRADAEIRAELARANPQGRLVQPADVASAVLWLAGAGAASVNGIALSISGGETG